MQPTDARSWSRDIALNKIENATPLESSEDERHACGVFKLDDYTVYKIIPNIDGDEEDDGHEVLALLRVRSHTSIPVPRVHGTVRQGHHTCAVMDVIQGDRLDHLWPNLSLWRKLGIAWTLRSYVRQLRRIPPHDPPRPGPLGSSPRMCQGLQFFQCDAGPFASPEEFWEYVRFYTLGISWADGLTDVREGEYTDDPLVFTHNDLNMRNIIVSQDGTVWLIDWDWSGYYPRYFEHIAATIAVYKRPEIPWSWKLCVPFITDPFFREVSFLTRPALYGS